MIVSRAVTLIALIIGAALFALTIAWLDVETVAAAARQLGPALPLVLLVSGLWHLLRTVAWALSFENGRPGLGRLTRVRLAAEAFSFMTIRGVAGEPLKVLLLARDTRPQAATAAVAVERVAYMVVTLAIVAAGSALSLAVLSLTPGWRRVFRILLITALLAVIGCALVVRGQGTYLRRWLDRQQQRRGWNWRRHAVGRFLVDVEARMLDVARGPRRRLAWLLVLETACFGLMTAEVWVVLVVLNVPASFVQAGAVETFSRVASMMSAFIPANLGALEASNVVVLNAVGAAAGAAAVAVARRLRGLWWAAVGFALYVGIHAGHEAERVASSAR